MFIAFSSIFFLSLPVLMYWFIDYTEGAELVDAVLDVVRKEAEGTDCLQGKHYCSQLALFPFNKFFRGT